MNVPPNTDALVRAVPVGTKPSRYALLLNFLPLLHVAAGAVVICSVDGVLQIVGVTLTWVYVLPPLMCRLAMAIFGRPEGENLGQDTRAFRVWWFLTQWQLLFNRFSVFEEVLRLVPGLYALWLNAWGSSVSPVVYWGPGAMVVDRHAVRVGPGTVIGTRAVLSGHLAVKDPLGTFNVTLAPIEIGAAVLVGAYAGIAPGCTVAANEEVPAAAFLRPFTRWAGRRRTKAARPMTG